VLHGRAGAHQKIARKVLSPYDLMIVLGADPLRMSVYSEVDPKPEGLPIVQVGLVDWDLAKNYGAEIALKADVKETLRALVPALKSLGGGALETRAKQGLATLASTNWTARRKPLVEQIRNAHLADRSTGWRTGGRGVSTTRSGRRGRHRGNDCAAPHRDRYGYHALASAASAGDCRSVGVNLANPNRPVVCSAMAARCIRSSRCGRQRTTLPLTFVIVNMAATHHQ
jgi:benzoylformate decarboxylase